MHIAFEIFKQGCLNAEDDTLSDFINSLEVLIEGIVMKIVDEISTENHLLSEDPAMKERIEKSIWTKICGKSTLRKSYSRMRF